jgi:folate-binding Fe-S cluster repair protein YgfZ
MIPAISLDAYAAARERAGLVDRPDRGRIVVSGVDRASFLQGLLTNDVVALKAGEGCYAAYLTAQGRMIADLDVYELGDVMLLVLPRDVTDAVIAKLDQVIFSEDVQLGDVTDTFAQLAVIGPGAASLVGRVLGVAIETLSAMAEHGNLRTSWPALGQFGDRHASGGHGRAGFDLYGERAWRELRRALIEAGAAQVDADTAEAIRIGGRAAVSS